MLTHRTLPRLQRGMTLVELMIAMLVGLVVVGAAISLAVSIMQANNDSIRTTRVTQELRGLADVVGAEVKRARGLRDPLSNVGMGSDALNACNTIEPAAGAGADDCLVFAYDCDAVGGGGRFRAIWRDDGSNQLMIAESDNVETAPTCESEGTALTAGDLEVTAASFAQTDQGAITISLTGRATQGDAVITRTITRTVWPRSNPVAVEAEEEAP